MSTGSSGRHGSAYITSASPASPQSLPNPEVVARPKRRYYTEEYKRRIVAEAAACTEPGQIGALLRREGLYSSHLVDWRRREQSSAGIAKSPSAELSEQNRRLRRDNARLQRRLEQAEAIIDVQKKLSELLGITLAPRETDGTE